VEANPQVVAVYAEAAADLVLIALLKENGAQKVAVGGAKLLQNAADVGLRFLSNEGTLEVNDLIGYVQVSLFQGTVLIVSAGILS
jgi:hypothetical protein